MLFEILLLFGFFLNGKALLRTIRNHRHFQKRNITDYPSGAQCQKRVSVLIPARNEEKNIRTCVETMVLQTYRNLEVIVLNDESTDKTGDILYKLGMKFPNRLQVIEGAPLKKGWVGKCFACHQLAQRATGDYLLFLDADTRASSRELVSQIIGAAEKSGVEFLSVFPHQKMVSKGELLGIPSIILYIFGVLDVPRFEDPNYPSDALAIGQCLLFTRALYEKIGGHEMLKNSIIEDVAFAYAIKKAKVPYLFLWGKDHLECRMYNSLAHYREGTLKNLMALFRIQKTLILAPLTQIVTVVLPCYVVMAAIFEAPLVHSMMILPTILSLAIHGGIVCFLASVYGKHNASYLSMVVLSILASFHLVFLFIEGFIRAQFWSLKWKNRVYA